MKLNKLFSLKNKNRNPRSHPSSIIHHPCAQRGASILEVLLSMAIIALISPFLYGQIAGASREIGDISTAKKIVAKREDALNFVRLNQDLWPANAQIKLSDDELAQITDTARTGFIDKYTIKGAAITDIYLSFELGQTATRTANIAKNIGSAAAIVGPDGVAYGDTWAVGAPDFSPGDLIYRINYNFNGDDRSKFLHRGTSGEDDLNVMRRDLNMGKFDIYNIGMAAAQTSRQTDSIAAFADVKDSKSSAVYFANGANMDGTNVKIGSMKVSGDITGFRNITTKKLNDAAYSTTGSVIADRATVSNSVNVGKDMNLKSPSVRTISGFVGIMAHSLSTSFLYANEMTFGGNFGLTVSGELLMSGTTPLKIGTWLFPSTTPPKFTRFELSRAGIPSNPNFSEFDKLIKSGWRDL